MKITTVQGDTLSNLALKHLGDASLWKDLGRQVGITTEEQARKLQPGIELTIPDAGESLEGTLGTEEASLILPSPSRDNLSVFGELL